MTDNDCDMILYKQFVVFHCSGLSVTRLSGYSNNTIFQGLQKESDYFIKKNKDIAKVTLAS